MGKLENKKNLTGVLLRSPASGFGDKVFYVDRGRRHWVSWSYLRGGGTNITISGAMSR